MRFSRNELSQFRSTLGVSESATPVEIHAAWKTLATRYHSEAGSEPNEEKWREVNNARDALVKAHEESIASGGLSDFFRDLQEPQEKHGRDEKAWQDFERERRLDVISARLWKMKDAFFQLRKEHAWKFDRYDDKLKQIQRETEERRQSIKEKYEQLMESHFLRFRQQVAETPEREEELAERWQSKRDKLKERWDNELSAHEVKAGRAIEECDNKNRENQIEFWKKAQKIQRITDKLNLRKIALGEYI